MLTMENHSISCSISGLQMKRIFKMSLLHLCINDQICVRKEFDILFVCACLCLLRSKSPITSVQTDPRWRNGRYTQKHKKLKLRSNFISFCSYVSLRQALLLQKHISLYLSSVPRSPVLYNLTIL